MTGASRKGLPKDRGMRHSHHFVEELFNRDDTSLGRLLPINSLEVNPDQPRNNVGDIEELTQSIKKHGVLEPLLVQRLEGGKHRIIAGERRYHAAKAAGLTQVPCIEVDILQEAEILEIALVENLQRKDLNPFEEANGYLSLKEKYDYTQEQIASVVGKKRSTVAETIKLTTMPEEIRNLCRHADITAKSILLEISKAGSLMEMRQMVDFYASGGTRAQLRDVRREEMEEDTGDESYADEGTNANVSPRPKPFIFRVKPESDHFSLSLRFKKEEVSRDEIIETLESIISQLKEEGE